MDDMDENELVHTEEFDIIVTENWVQETYDVVLPHQCDSWDLLPNLYVDGHWVQVRYDKGTTLKRLRLFQKEIEECIDAINA